MAIGGYPIVKNISLCTDIKIKHLQYAIFIDFDR